MLSFSLNLVGEALLARQEVVDLPDLTARFEALILAGEWLREQRNSWSGEAWRMKVTNAAGVVLFSLRLEPAA